MRVVSLLGLPQTIAVMPSGRCIQKVLERRCGYVNGSLFLLVKRTIACVDTESNHWKFFRLNDDAKAQFCWPDLYGIKNNISWSTDCIQHFDVYGKVKPLYTSPFKRKNAFVRTKAIDCKWLTKDYIQEVCHWKVFGQMDIN